MDLSIAMIRAKHDLREKIKEMRSVVPIPPYVMSSILSEIQTELKDEEKELLTVMYLETEAKLEERATTTAKEEGEDAEDNILHDDREPNEE